jgi:ribonuclease R
MENRLTMSKHTILDRRVIVETLQRLATPGIKLTALADSLGLRERDHARLRQYLLDLVEEGKVKVMSGGAFALAPAGREADQKASQAQRAAAAHKATASVAFAPALAKIKAEKPVRVHGQKTAAVITPAAPPRSRRPSRAHPASSTQAPPVRTRLVTGGVSVASPTSSPAPVRSPWASRASSPLSTPMPVNTPSPATPARAEPFVVGRITVHPAGYGFVASDSGFDVFIPAKYRGQSLDGDRVQVTTWPGVRGTEGRVDEVLARGRARLTGVVRRAGRMIFLEPDDPRIAADYGRVGLDDIGGAHDGAVVVVEITRYPTAGLPELAGRVLRILGEPGDPRTEIEKIVACASLPVEFPEAVAAQAEGTPDQVGPADLADRIDLRDRRFCTIDPETARDFDDALCIEDAPGGGRRVWVAVADVGHYVRWDDPLDCEAAIRGVSVYLPDRVIPMLPQRLSAGICSLNPGVDRCAMVVRLDFSPTGEVVDAGYAAAVIRSQARLDYPGVAAALEGDFRGRRQQYRDWEGELTALHQLAQLRRAHRKARGALDLDLPEPKVILDADDPRLVRDVVQAKGDPQVKRAYELVEEFMIAANEAVGRFFRQRGALTVWRVHAVPARDRIEALAEVLGAIGIRVDIDEAMTPVGMKRVLDEVLTRPASRALSFLVLRSLTQAVWNTEPLGHFGLASEDYLHFTSPIRRYPDLLVHRLLKYHLHREGQASGGGYRLPPPPAERMQELAAASSANERRAMEAEREAVAMYRSYFVRDQVGERFTGTVTAVTSFGAFVEIEHPYVEGLVKLDSFDEPFELDEVHMRLRGRRTGRSIALGDSIAVEIINVSVARRKIDLRWLEGGGKAAPPLEVAARTPIGKQRKVAREITRAAAGDNRSARPAHSPPTRTSRGGLRIGVSHRELGKSGDGDGGRKGRQRKRRSR